MRINNYYARGRKPGFAPRDNFTRNDRSPQARGLIGWWPMLMRDGLVLDMSINENHLTPGNDSGSGAPVLTRNPFGGPAMKFTAANKHHLESTSPPVTGPPYSFTAWCVTNSLAIDDQVLMGLADSSTNVKFSGIEVRITGSPDGRIRAGDFNSATPTGPAETSNVVIVGKPQFVVGTYRSTSVRAAYLNAGGKGTANESVTAWTADRLGIGAFRDSTPRAWMDGLIWDARLYDHELSDMEVSAMMAARHQLKKIDLSLMIGRNAPAGNTLTRNYYDRMLAA